MDASAGGSAGSDDKKDDNQNPKKGEPSYHIFTSEQEVKLEAFFEDCPNPSESQCTQLAKELGTDSEKIKLWFHKKSQTKMSQPESQAPERKSTDEGTCVLCQECDINELDQPNDETPNDNVNPNPTGGSCKEYADREKARVLRIAASAMDELLKLISQEVPLWIRPLNDAAGVVLVPAIYVNTVNPMLPKLLTPDKREESSKEALMVRGGGKQLVDLMLNSEEWANLFPTIVSKAETLKVFNLGAPENRNGALQLMYEEMHILSPLVPSREFFFLRYCRQVEDGVWVIANVSLDTFEAHTTSNAAHKLPSGCMIREMPNGESCVVTWIEHVILNDRSQWVRLYGDLIHKYNPFGAKRWLFALQRKCEKNHCCSFEYIPRPGIDREIRSQQGRKSIMDLSNRMVQTFCRALNKSDMTRYTQAEGPQEIQCTICRSATPGQPEGFVINATSSILLPISPQALFHFLSDETRRQEWDILALENPVNEITYISIGNVMSFNRVSILETINNADHEDNNMQILQECCIDSTGAYVVYAPIDAINMKRIVNGGNASEMPILPSGFMISGDGHFDDDDIETPSRPRRRKGSLLTLCYQILICSGPAFRDNVVNMEYVTSVSKIFIDTIQKIKTALNCPDED